VSVRVRTDEAGLLASIAERLPPEWRRSKDARVGRLFSLIAGDEGRARGVRRLSLLYSGATLLARTPDREAALDALASHVELYVAERSPRCVFVHAGAVGWRGRAVVIPGRSLSGKTTLVAELIKAGADYYSDEYAVLDREGLVHPYARPLAVREGAGCKRSRRPPADFGARVGAAPLPVGMVVVSRYEEGARWRPRRLSHGGGLLEMLANTVSARLSPARVMNALSRVVAEADLLAGSRGDAARAAEAILRRLDS
jgi:hypothetical protein